MEKVVNKRKYLAMLIMALGLVGVILGAVFVGLATEKNQWMSTAMAQEKVTLGLTEQQIKSGEVVDSAAEAQTAGDVIRSHRRAIAPTYNELLGGGKYDPTKPQQLSYSQALNMENYLYLAVLGFGVTTLITGVGASMIVMGIGLGLAGLLLFQNAKKTSAIAQE